MKILHLGIQSEGFPPGIARAEVKRLHEEISCYSDQSHKVNRHFHL